MFQAWVRSAGQFLNELHRSWRREDIAVPIARPNGAPGKARYEPLQQVVLTDEVGRTLFDEYAAHRKSDRGHEETGWLLLGLREPRQAVVLATLPAGTASDAGVAHVRFDSNGQALGSRIVRQADRRLTTLGVVHTHPGTLRHPSDADYRGDAQWVGQLRGREGIFGIGTADGEEQTAEVYARQPRPHVQCLGPLCLSWYALRQGDPAYRPLTYGMTIGPDLARPLHPIWPTLEAHAERVDRLCRQQTGVSFEVVAGPGGPALAIHVPLATPGEGLRVHLQTKAVRYYLERNGDLLAAEMPEDRVDRGVYLLLAELAAQS
jgi:proteasome lid subunit RPN8/RPN11